ncbi:hypothetical protein Axi01nite_53980 [Actinoplanes xinjiangensis]|nr:hypothetical protein Axi01nite_53980 [Actinoplanes xinjiangensis]
MVYGGDDAEEELITDFVKAWAEVAKPGPLRPGLIAGSFPGRPGRPHRPGQHRLVPSATSGS